MVPAPETLEKFEIPEGGEVSPPGSRPDPGEALRILRSVLPRRLLRSAGELAREGTAAGSPLLPTALAALDRLLGGGLPRGRLVELVGRRSSGRFSLTLLTLAAATGTGHTAVLVDLGDGLDPQAAATLGVDLERLLWLRPRSFREALATAETALAGGFPLVALDLGARGERGGEAPWLRLARAAARQGTALLVASPRRISGTAAEVVLEVRPAGAAWEGGGRGPCLFTGISSRLAVTKARRGRPGGEEPLRLAVPSSVEAGRSPAGEARPLPPPRRAGTAAAEGRG